MNQDQLEFARLWVFKAEEDLLVVRQLMQTEMPVRSAIGFHCQQAAEKFLKAFLAFHQKEIIRTHNIEFLLNLCSQINSRFSEIDPENLTDFGVEVRYPGDFLEPTFKEIQSMNRIVGEIRDIGIKFHYGWFNRRSSPLSKRFMPTACQKRKMKNRTF